MKDYLKQVDHYLLEIWLDLIREINFVDMKQLNRFFNSFIK